MAIMDTIARLLRPGQPPKTTADEMQAMQRERGQAGATDIAHKFASERDRRRRVELSRTMYESDPRIKRALQETARDATKGGFQFETEDEEAAAIVTDLRQRVKMDKLLDDWCRLTWRDGDTMLELGITADRRIASITRKPTMQLHRNTDNRDMFADPDRAFWMARHPWDTQPSADTIWFAQWQIVHARWDHDEGKRYGRPMFSAADSAWKRVKEGELDVAVRRKVRAGMKLIHSIEGDRADVEAYKEANRPALDNPFAAISDIFTNKKVSVEAVQGDARLNEIDDVRHHIHTMWMSSPIPMGILGYGTDIDFSVIGHQKEQYDETLVGIQEWLSDELLVPVIDTQLLLAGKLPESVDYSIKWQPKQRVTAQDIKDMADAALKLQMLGIPGDIIAIVIARFLPGIDPDMLVNSQGTITAERLSRVEGAFMDAIRGK